MFFFVHIGGAMVLDTSTMFRAGDIQVHILFVGEPRWLQAKKSRDTDTARPCVGLMFSSCWLRQSHLFSYWSGLKSSFDLYQPAYWLRQSHLLLYWSWLISSYEAVPACLLVQAISSLFLLVRTEEQPVPACLLVQTISSSFLLVRTEGQL